MKPVVLRLSGSHIRAWKLAHSGVLDCLRLVLLTSFISTESAAKPRAWNLNLDWQIHLLLASILLDHLNVSIQRHLLLTTGSSVRSVRSPAPTLARGCAPLLPPVRPCQLKGRANNFFASAVGIASGLDIG